MLSRNKVGVSEVVAGTMTMVLDPATLCPCDGIGIRAGFRFQILWVRLPSGVFGKSDSYPLRSESIDSDPLIV